MAVGKQIISNLGISPDNLVSVTIFLDDVVPFPSVGSHNRPGLNKLQYGTSQALSRSIRDNAKANSSNPLAVNLGHDEHQGFSKSPTSPLACFLPSYKCLVYLNDAGYSLPSRSYHCPTHFVHPRPSGSITAKSKNTLQSKRICPVFLARNVSHGTEPEPKRLLSILKYCPSGYGGLKGALFTLKQSV